MTKPETPAWIRLDDRTTWPRPALESDEHYGPAHTALHFPGDLTRGDLMYLASVAQAYGHLVATPSAAKALPTLRRALREELDMHQPDNAAVGDGEGEVAL